MAGVHGARIGKHVKPRAKDALPFWPPHGFRRLILGVDTRSGGAGPLRGFPMWNLDLAVNKDIRIREGLAATLSFQFVNVLNHFQPANPSLSIDNPASWGVIGGQAIPPRQIEFGLRIFF